MSGIAWEPEPAAGAAPRVHPLVAALPQAEVLQRLQASRLALASKLAGSGVRPSAPGIAGGQGGAAVSRAEVERARHGLKTILASPSAARRWKVIAALSIYYCKRFLIPVLP